MRALSIAIALFAIGCDGAAMVDADARPPRRDGGPRADGGPPILGGPGCGLEAAAFCDTFDAVSEVRGRGGDLDPSRWSASRGNPQLPTGNGVVIAAGP